MIHLDFIWRLIHIGFSELLVLANIYFSWDVEVKDFLISFIFKVFLNWVDLIIDVSRYAVEAEIKDIVAFKTWIVYSF